MKYSMLVTSALYNVTSGTPVFNAVIFFIYKLFFLMFHQLIKKNITRNFFTFHFSLFIFLKIIF